jgi:1-acyl-sn-glycerol-3-phosphate acyltransferase
MSLKQFLKRKRKLQIFGPPTTKLGKRLRDPFGNVVLIKRLLTSIIGAATFRRFSIVNDLDIKGFDYLEKLPETNVLFVSNHQTYFADVMALYHVFSRVKWRIRKRKNPIYLLLPRAKAYYIAAEETMKKSGLLPRIFSYAGAVTVRRSWRHKGKTIEGSSDIKAPAKIKKALDYGWVITFPQGTTTPGAPIRKGAASLIKVLDPIVVPVKLAGFREAFDKKGLRYQKKGVKLSIAFGEPKQFGKDVELDTIQDYLEEQILGIKNSRVDE